MSPSVISKWAVSLSRLHSNALHNITAGPIANNSQKFLFRNLRLQERKSTTWPRAISKHLKPVWITIWMSWSENSFAVLAVAHELRNDKSVDSVTIHQNGNKNV